MSPMMFGASAAVCSAWHWLPCGPVRPRHWHGARHMTPELLCWCTTREARRRVVAQSPSLAWSVVTRDDVIPLRSLAVCYSGEWLTPLPRRRSLADCHRGVTPDAAVEL